MANLMEIVVEELETAESDEEKNAESPCNSYRHFTLVLKGEKQSCPTYLLIDSKAEKVSWPNDDRSVRVIFSVNFVYAYFFFFTIFKVKFKFLFINCRTCGFFT